MVNVAELRWVVVESPRGCHASNFTHAGKTLGPDLSNSGSMPARVDAANTWSYSSSRIPSACVHRFVLFLGMIGRASVNAGRNCVTVAVCMAPPLAPRAPAHSNGDLRAADEFDVVWAATLGFVAILRQLPSLLVSRMRRVFVRASHGSDSRLLRVTPEVGVSPRPTSAFPVRARSSGLTCP